MSTTGIAATAAPVTGQTPDDCERAIPPEAGDGPSEASAVEAIAQGTSAPAELLDAEPESVGEIRMAAPFSDLFAALPAKVTGIATDMRANGFDAAHPVVVWQETGLLIDGHCRVLAARIAGIDSVPVVYRTFEDEDAALDYAIHTQMGRRNLTDADIFCLVQQLDKRRQRGGDRRSEKAAINAPDGAIDPAVRSSQETADRIGVSPRTVERVRHVIDVGDARVIEAVKAGDMTIHKAAKDVGGIPAAVKDPEVSQTVKRSITALGKIDTDLATHGDCFAVARRIVGELTNTIREAAAATGDTSAG